MTIVNGWQWGYQGVDLYEDHLTWYENAVSTSFAGGGACDQTLEDYLERGPWVGGVPADVVDEVTRAVHALAAVKDGP